MVDVLRGLDYGMEYVKDGKSQTAREWMLELGLTFEVVMKRWREEGWSQRDAFTTALPGVEEVNASGIEQKVKEEAMVEGAKPNVRVPEGTEAHVAMTYLRELIQNPHYSAKEKLVAAQALLPYEEERRGTVDGTKERKSKKAQKEDAAQEAAGGRFGTLGHQRLLRAVT